MVTGKYVKLEQNTRAAFRQFWLDNLSGKQDKSLIIPNFEINRCGNVELLFAPSKGITICIVQRSDYISTYKHTVGHMVGALVHFYQMSEREVRAGLNSIKDQPDITELDQPSIAPIKLAKKLCEDRQKGAISLAIVTEVPEVPQQAKELVFNFFPIVSVLRDTLTATVKKKKLCQSLEIYGVDLKVEPVKIEPLKAAVDRMLKTEK